MSTKENNGAGLREKIIAFTIKAVEIAALAFLAGGFSTMGAKSVEKRAIKGTDVVPFNRKTGS